MAKTKVKENMNYYQRVLNRDAARVQDGTYKEVLDKLRILMEQTERLYQPGEQGQYRQMNESDCQSLMKAYQEMGKACSNYFEDSREKQNLDKSRAHIVKRLQDYVNKDLSCLEKLDRNHLPSLPDAIKQARTVQIDLTGKNLTTVGGAQSKRIPLKSANGKTGFFTEKSGFDKQKSWEELMDGVLPKIPEKFQEDFMDLRNDPECRDAFCDLMDVYEDASKKKNNTMQSAALIKMYERMTRRGATSSEKYDICFRDKQKETEMAQLATCFHEMEQNSRGMRIKDNHINCAGIQSGKRLDQRNSAMSAVADLLGTPQVIARSTPMTIVRDGKVVEGTFMESAQGTDINHPGKQDMWLQGKDRYDIGGPGALKQLAELQVLDYICGNIDRHIGNMLYQFEEKDDQVCLAKITGIDNDDCFGTNLLDDKYTGMSVQPGVTQIKVISARQANVIRNLNKDILKETLLPYELTDKEMEAAWDRIGCLKKEIKKGNIAIVKDSEWKDKNLYELAQGNNIFERVSEVPQFMYTKMLGFEPGHKKPLDYAEGEKVQDEKLFQMNLEQSHNKLMRLVKQIHDADRNLYINSSEFRKMRNALYDLGKFSKDMKEKYPEGGMKIDPKDRQELNKRYENLRKFSEAYIEAKKLSPKTEHGQLRLHLANELRDLAEDSCEFLGNEAENPQISAPSNAEPQKEEPQKEEPQKEQPQKEQPQKEQPQKEEPQKEQPQKEESQKEEAEIEDPEPELG